MSVLRLLLVLVFFTLLSSCEQKEDTKRLIEGFNTHLKLLTQYIIGGRNENPCALGVPQTAQCFYLVTITTDDYATNGLRGGKASIKVCYQNRDSGNPFEDCSKFNPAERHFPVKGSPALQKGSDYEFFSQVTTPPTSELVCVTVDDQTGKGSPQCVPFPPTKNLPTGPFKKMP